MCRCDDNFEKNDKILDVWGRGGRGKDALRCVKNTKIISLTIYVKNIGKILNEVLEWFFFTKKKTVRNFISTSSSPSKRRQIHL